MSVPFHSTANKNIISKVREYYINAEANAIPVMQDLEAHARRQDADQHEAEKLARSLGRLLQRWRRSTTLSIETITEITEQLQREIKASTEEERRLRETDIRLRKIIVENTNVRSAIQQLEEILQIG
jgi:hypothetical protein